MNSWTPLGRAGRFGALAALVVLAACRPDTVETRYANLQIETVDGFTREPIYDFGPVFRGRSETQTLIIKNNGQVALTVTDFKVTTGDASKVGLAADAANVVFTVPLAVDTIIEPSKEVAVDILFTPPPDTVNPAPEDFTFKLTLTTTGGKEGENEAVITLKGQAVPGVCDLPEVLDFGTVARGDTGIQEVIIDNPSKIEATALVGEVESSRGDQNAFRFEDGSARGTVSIVPGGEARVSIGFSPTEAKTYLATVKMRAADSCPEVPVTLTGKGVDQVLTWRVENEQFCKTRDADGVCQDNLVECGFVTPNTVAIHRTLTFMNAGNKEVEVKNLRFSRWQTEFFVEGDVGVGTANPLKVPAKTGTAQGEATVTLGCKRTSLGRITAFLTGETSLQSQSPFGQVQAIVTGGGPDISVRPSPTLNFGPVAYFADAQTPVSVDRRMVVANIGTLSDDPLYNLHISSVTVTEEPGTEPGTFSVQLAPGSTLPPEGIVARAGKNQVVYQVRVTPQSFGQKAAKLTIVSNDPDSPNLTVDLTADVRDLPPCNYSITPNELTFGVVEPGTTREQSFTITNLAPNSKDICLISNFQMSAEGETAGFLLPEYAGEGGADIVKELPGGESLRVLVRVQPKGDGGNVPTVFGTAQFYISSKDASNGEVNMSASVTQACLVVVPSDLDFGVVKKGCSSQLRTFSLYNACPADVTVLGFSVLDGAGQPAGGPDCAGPSSCPEFSIAQQPKIPTGGLVVKPGGSAITFMARYAPIDYSSDMGTISVNALQNQNAATYVVTVRGRGDTQGLNTDVFAQDSKPKSDVLFCIDNSGSMGDEQEDIGNNFDAFIKYAVKSQVDYRMAVITSDMDKVETDAGKFRLTPGSNEKILTAQTPGVESKFFDLVTSVGTNGSATEKCFEPVLKALTAPLVTGDNAGFMREDATLAIVAVTDELEQSDEHPVTYYLQRFLEFKGLSRTHLFSFNAIAAFDGSCTSAEDGKYAFMVEQTKGVKGEICTEDWTTTLEAVGKSATGYRTTFSLGSQPDLTNGNQFRVELTDQEGDTQELPQFDNGNRRWRYDSTSNSIVFEPAYVPEPGQTLAVTYNTTCYAPPSDEGGN